jgi:hypothetical protein
MEAWQRAGSLEVYHYGEKRECRLGYGLIEDAAQYEDYPDCRQPALVFHGAHDEVVSPRVARAFAEGHSQVQLEILDSGHDLLNVLEYMLPRAAAFLGG